MPESDKSSDAQTVIADAFRGRITGAPDTPEFFARRALDALASAGFLVAHISEFTHVQSGEAHNDRA